MKQQRRREKKRKEEGKGSGRREGINFNDVDTCREEGAGKCREDREAERKGEIF